MAWGRLWAAYLDFYRGEVSPEDTEVTFGRLSEGRDGMLGLVAVDDSRGEAIGIAHLVFHPSTWSSAPYCYLEDLYVDPAARGTGTAKALIEALYKEADARGCSRVYWETQEFNSAARSLYDTLAHRTSFIIYER
jgi:GNAT superfamily N-acetyltransferase